MRLPDITKTINNVQRNTVPDEDKPIICAAVQDYWKKMYAICATKQNVELEYEAPKGDNKILFKYLDKMTKDDLIELAGIFSVSVTEDNTREQIITKIRG